MRKNFLTCLALLMATVLFAKKVEITKFRCVTPIEVIRPFMIDSVNAGQKAFSDEMLLDSYTSLANISAGTEYDITGIPKSSADYSINLISFNMENRDFVKGKLSVKGLKNYRIYVDGKKSDGKEIALEPATHTFVIKYLSKKNVADSLSVDFDTDNPEDIIIGTSVKRMYTINSVVDGKRVSSVSISPSGKYIIISYLNTLEGGTLQRRFIAKEVASGKIISQGSEEMIWMPSSDIYYTLRKGDNGRDIVAFNPHNGSERIFAYAIPEGRFQISPNEEYLLYSIEQEGPKEKKEIYQVLEPDDRQPGWRNRNSLFKYDIKSRIMQPLTYGYRNVWASDISKDGRYILLMMSKARLTKRPTTLFSLLRLDTRNMKVDTLVEDDGFISNACFSPDGKSVAITGSPEAFAGIGKNLPEGKIPNMFDMQLYIMDIASKSVRAMTKEFNPSVGNISWSTKDGKIYFTAENRDYISMYSMTPVTGKIDALNLNEEIIKSFSLADKANMAVYFGQSASNSDRVYLYDCKSGKSTLMDDISREILDGIKLGECHNWNFVNSRGDTIYGRYYLPPSFDKKKSYPMIVNYYGGCSPTSRNFESRYPHHAYAAMGYVVYVLQPSGATGFGQEFSSRHVNTAGEGVADDIIEGTKQFVKEHSYVDSKKIGCIGASYGGFMTQYLQTKTDIFACAISHAGISDHTSYWGEGYWGYSYSEVSMANSYPWQDVDLYVKQSPLYNAEKINTPILFLHGDVDKNVPVGESIQMFTALKLLGKETAMVLVNGQDHHITEYNKRLMWQNTIYAWFAKWLKDKPLWWNEIYSPKKL